MMDPRSEFRRKREEDKALVVRAYDSIEDYFADLDAGEREKLSDLTARMRANQASKRKRDPKGPLLGDVGGTIPEDK
jgi:hypothetical protein